MDKAIDLWINFFDTAELYSVPPSKETFWVTENIIWKWMKSRNSRDKIIIATKVAWPARPWFIDYVRWWNTCFDKKNIELAIEWSLKRLWTDYIDLYQLHWPDRNLHTFGQRHYIPYNNEQMRPIEETLEVLKSLQDKWKVRCFWLSNESPWWTMKFLQIAKEKNLPRMVSVQNNYSLLTRTFDTGMSEVCTKEDIGLLAYSPLGFWVLWWRYLDWNKPVWWRLTKYPNYLPRYQSHVVENIIKQYKSFAEDNGLTLPQLALAFVYCKPFLTSTIIWPSNVDQLIEDTQAINIQLSKNILKSIENINEKFPNPCA